MEVLPPSAVVTTKRSVLAVLSALRFLGESLKVTWTLPVAEAVKASAGSFTNRFRAPILTRFALRRPILPVLSGGARNE